MTCISDTKVLPAFDILSSSISTTSMALIFFLEYSIYGCLSYLPGKLDLYPKSISMQLEAKRSTSKDDEHHKVNICCLFHAVALRVASASKKLKPLCDHVVCRYSEKCLLTG